MVYAIDSNTTQMVYVDKKLDCIKQKSVINCINDVCLDGFSTYEGRMAAMRKKLNIKRNPPLIVSEEHRYFLIQVKCEINGLVWLNYDYMKSFDLNDDFCYLNVREYQKHRLVIKTCTFNSIFSKIGRLITAVDLAKIVS